MQWAYEAMKLDSTVKHLSWVPPWVRVADSERANKFCEVFFGTDENNPCVIVDEVGLGRHPSLWWTMNCKYNAAYDVQRLNTPSTQGVSDVGGSTAGARQERFEFARDNPDLVAYMLTLRTELLMRIVMPAVVGHSDSDPYMDMARFEVGPGGNPHWHGMSVGLRSPQFRHVKDDVGGEGDLPPETASEDVRACQRLWEKEDPDAWLESAEKSGVGLDGLVRRALSGTTAHRQRHGQEDGAEHTPTEPSDSDGRSDSDAGEDGAPIDLLSGRVRDAVEGLVDAGLIELVTEGGAPADGDWMDRRYRRVPPVPDVPVTDGSARPRSSRRRWKKGEKLSTLVDPGILQRGEVEGRDRSA